MQQAETLICWGGRRFTSRMRQKSLETGIRAPLRFHHIIGPVVLSLNRAMGQHREKLRNTAVRNFRASLQSQDRQLLQLSEIH